jgi:2,4-dienoyl-CoA reductase-like NADH-dependent reductase (Old Yellow Enzyme family)
MQLESKNFTRKNEFTLKEIDASINALIQFAKRVKRINADGIQIHCAHGTPLNAFFSPVANKRNDKYGGSVENRCQILVDIVSELQSVADDNFLVSLKINGSDCVPRGSTPEDAAKLVSLLPRVDLVEVSCGYGSMALYSRSHYNEKNLSKILPEKLKKNLERTVSQSKKEYPLFEGYNLGFAEVVKKVNPQVNVGVVGGFKKLKTMEEVLEKVEFVSLGRPFLRQPDLVAKFNSGVISEVECVRCDQCHLFRDYDPPGRCYLKENYIAKFKK